MVSDQVNDGLPDYMKRQLSEDWRFACQVGHFVWQEGASGLLVAAEVTSVKAVMESGMANPYTIAGARPFHKNVYMQD